MTSDSRTFLPSRVDSVKSGGFSPTVGGAAAANGSTAANAAKDINARFKVITSLRNSAKTRRLRSIVRSYAQKVTRSGLFYRRAPVMNFSTSSIAAYGIRVQFTCEFPL